MLHQCKHVNNLYSLHTHSICQFSLSLSRFTPSLFLIQGHSYWQFPQSTWRRHIKHSNAYIKKIQCFFRAYRQREDFASQNPNWLCCPLPVSVMMPWYARDDIPVYFLLHNQHALSFNDDDLSQPRRRRHSSICAGQIEHE